LFATAELPEELMWQLADLRALMPELDEAAKRVQSAARALRTKIGKSQAEVDQLSDEIGPDWRKGIDDRHK
jgi:hypothetical protein